MMDGLHLCLLADMVDKMLSNFQIQISEKGASFGKSQLLNGFLGALGFNYGNKSFEN